MPADLPAPGPACLGSAPPPRGWVRAVQALQRGLAAGLAALAAACAPTVLDPDLRGGAAFVLLANTVHPSRDGVVGRSRALRRAFHVAAASSLG